MIFKANKILVVGGNAAGPAAAAKAKRTNPEAEVILFEAGNFISTGTCELPFLLSGEIKDYNSIVFFNDQSFQKEKGVKVFTNHQVNSIDIRTKSIAVTNLTDNTSHVFDYDSLILATGSQSINIPGIPNNVGNLFSYKSVTDYLKIKEFIENNRVRNIAIIGAGYIGLETAETLTKAGYSVTIFEKDFLPLPGYEPEVREKVKELFEENNVNIIYGCSDIKYIFSNDRISSIKVDSRITDIDLVIGAIGVRPNTSLAQSAGLSVGTFGGIKVDNYLRTSNPSIFAVGDAIEVREKISNSYAYLPLATFAHEQGHVAGENAAGGRVMVEPVVKNTVVKLFDKTVTSVGLNYHEVSRENHKIDFVEATLPNLVKVMPQSGNVYGKVTFDKYSGKVYGASFFGEKETVGYSDIISLMINNNIPIQALSKVRFAYSPPSAPFVNLLSFLSRKAQGKMK